MNILSFGEILWDIYPQKTVIGGAAFNFSAHMSKLGGTVDFVTAVGNDPLGPQALAYIREYEIGDAFAGFADYPTGRCFVSIDAHGQPSYDLAYGMAYDHIVLTKKQWGRLQDNSYQALYFGTLAQRSEESRKTLAGILSRCRFSHILFDINIRHHWYSPELIEKGLHCCCILKVSREEAGVFEKSGLIGMVRSQYPDEEAALSALCRALAHKYDIAIVLMTLDKNGAMAYEKAQDSAYRSGEPKGKVVSSVGAGDSFAAGFLHAYLQRQPIESCLRKAVLLSDYVVGHMEAVPPYSEELRKHLSV